MEKLAQQIVKSLRRPDLRKLPRNWGLKLVSLLLAVLLWYFVAGEDKVDTNILIPVEIVNLPQELIVANQFKKELEVTVSGPRGLISGLGRQHVARTINLSKATPGTMVVSNDPETINFPRGIKVLRIQPSHLTLAIDQLVEKNLPVEVRTEGAPAMGFELTSIAIEPHVIRVAGPRTPLAQVESLRTAPITLSGLKTPVTLQVPLELTPEMLDLIGETVVTANVTVREKTVERFIGGIVLRAVGAGPKKVVAINPTRIGAKVRMPLSKEGGELNTQLEARVVVEGLPPGVHRLPVEVVGNSQITVLDVQPEMVIVEIGK
ncbi:MAG: YbbR-like domain-containing protein [Thermodesulfobacteriota bacterium]